MKPRDITREFYDRLMGPMFVSRDVESLEDMIIAYGEAEYKRGQLDPVCISAHLEAEAFRRGQIEMQERCALMYGFVDDWKIRRGKAYMQGVIRALPLEVKG